MTKGRFTGEEIGNYVWWFSPLYKTTLFMILGVLVFSCRGDFTGEEMYNFTLVLPSVYFLLIDSIVFDVITCRGDYTG